MHQMMTNDVKTPWRWACARALAICVAASSTVVPSAVWALVAAEAGDGRDVARRMIYRNDGETLYRRVTMLTCRYQVSGNNRSCVSRPVRKSIESLTMDDGPQRRDTVGLGIILEPASERNVAFLQRDYDDPDRDTDQWMYFPALKKLKRIVSESPNSPKTGSIFGSEVAYEDNERMQLDDYSFELVGEEEVDGRRCQVIEATPTDSRAPRTSYARQRIWVDRASGAALKRELYGKRHGRLVKTFFLKDLVESGEAWVGRVEIVVNHESGRMTMVRAEELAINVPLDRSLFDTRALEDAAYREGQMRQLRNAARSAGGRP